MKRKIAVVVASRANYARIRSVLSAIRDHAKLELQFIVGASAMLERYGSVIDIIRAEGFEPDATVHMVIDGETPLTMAKSTGLAIIELSSIFDRLKPDIVVSVADRYETMATAIAASYMNIHLAHTQGGEVTGSIDESVRHSITKLAHFHFPATELSRQRITQLGEDPANIFVTGCPALDLISETDLSTPPIISNQGVGNPIDPSTPYLLVIQHPVTTEFKETTKQIETTIDAIDRLKYPTIWLWPNVDAGSDAISHQLRVFREIKDPQYLYMVKNFSPTEYLQVMNSAGCGVGNSSSFLREGALLGLPIVNIGSRQQGRERAKNVIDVPYNADEIEQAIKKQLKKKRYEPFHLYGDGQAGKKIANILAKVKLGSNQKTFRLAQHKTPL